LFFFTAEHIRELQSTASEISLELNDAIRALGDLHLKHRQLTEKHHEERYLNARSKAEQKRLKGILLKHEMIYIRGYDPGTYSLRPELLVAEMDKNECI
jgi:hypothetical protein